MTDPLLPTTDRPPPPDRRPRQRRVSAGRLLAAIVVLALVMVLLIVSVGALLGRLGGSSSPDFEGDGTDPVVIQVPQGASPPQVGRLLAEAGVVKSAAAFSEAAAEDDASARKLQPGYYRLRKQMSGQAAFRLLLDPESRAESKFTLPEGVSVRQALPVISKGTGIPVADLEAAVRTPTDLGLPPYAQGVEGFLFPATYDVAPDAKAADVLRMMVRRFDQEARRLDLVASSRRQNLTPLQIITLASIVEREVNTKGDRGKAARVIFNRLEDKERFPTLGMDSTVRYALDDYQGPLTQSRLDTDSPYNTRKVPGIPPGPIGNPGAAALEAVLDPPPGPWTYFVFLPSENQTIFTADQAEFADLEARYRAETGGG